MWKSDGDGIEERCKIPQPFYTASIISPYLFGTIKARGEINSPLSIGRKIL
jgi:hypothetical protein